MEIVLKKLGVSIDNTEILQSIDLALMNKEFVGLIGPNGSGKSTVLRTIYRALKRTRGDIYLDGIPLDSIAINESAKQLGVMKQTMQLAFDFKVIDLVLLGRTPYKKPMELDNAEDYKIARDALAMVGLSNYEERSYTNLSGGEQQRVMIARVLAGRPKTLLLDELTNHLDIYYQFHLLDIVKSLNTEVLAVMHDLNMAAQYCDKLYLLLDGRIVAFGRTEAVLTPQFIEQVFKVRALVEKDDAGKVHILYRGCL